MSSHVKKWTSLLLSLGGLLGGGVLLLLTLAFFDRSPLTFESLESKGKTGNPVFNQITWLSDKKKDIWLMRQTHDGLGIPQHQWDRLAIVIDKVKGRKARFYQLVSGPLQWTEIVEKPRRAACFLCHSNGPRAIRPKFDSQEMELGSWDRLRTLAWNLRIKTYGPIESEEDPTTPSSQVPFKYSGSHENARLLTKTCVMCHNDSAWGRNFLVRQNFLAIEFLIEKKMMPPPGFSLSSQEREEISTFLKGN